MRDINRIDKVLDKFGRAWKLYPDMRYVQFLQFLLGEFLPEEWQGQDLFFMEEDVLEKALDKMLEEHNG